jgi:predicted small integral membrane protein
MLELTRATCSLPIVGAGTQRQEHSLVTETQTDAKTEAEPREPLIPRFRVTRQERNRLILVGLATVVLVWLLTNSSAALGPFILALVLAYLMLPSVDFIAHYLPRVVAIVLVAVPPYRFAGE